MDCTIPPTPFDCPFELAPGRSPDTFGASSVDDREVELNVGEFILRFAGGWLRGEGWERVTVKGRECRESRRRFWTKSAPRLDRSGFRKSMNVNL